MDVKLQQELRKLQEAAGIKYGSGIYDQIGSTADKEEPKQKQAGITGAGNDIVDEASDDRDSACNNNDCVTDVDADGYFPDTEHGIKVDATGPASAKMGDNPMQKSMKTKVEESQLSEGLRLIDKQVGTDVTTKTYYNSEFGEYQVKVFENGVYNPEADYFTDDKDDAFATAKHIAKTNGNVSINEMRKLAGLAEGCHYDESVDEDEDGENEQDSKEVVKEAYSAFFNLLQEEFKKANLK